MRGRDKFRRAKAILSIITFTLKIVPRPLLRWLWVLSDGLPDVVGVSVRYCLLRRQALRCGDNVLVGRGVEIRYPERLVIGSNVSIHKQCYLDAFGGIEIENDVSIAHQTSLISFEHTWNDEALPIRDNPIVTGKIHIRNDVWIGCGCRILSGVEVSGRSVVAAGSVVTRSVSAGTVVGGIPAKLIKTIKGGGGYERSVGS
ncbi:acyltransferase [Cohnella abietis]|uniref:Acyltransferase n=1 Tax=Cohnella abietis TaxID=2507935 RepID=A0A3T1D1Y4_9BACL|nr:acyltransferase [Cohnella abietis]BBI32094.1 acyltransferase [Cohnella abietis]